MESQLNKEIKTTGKKTAVSFAPWAIVGILFCCGGPIVLLALFSGGISGILGFVFSNLFLISAGVIIFLLALFWFLTKFTKLKKQKN